MRRGRYTGPLHIEPAGFGVSLGPSMRPIEDFIREIAEDTDLMGGTFNAEIEIKLKPRVSPEDEAWADYKEEQEEAAR